MYLAEIRGTVSTFAETISKILDIDVMIVDNNHHKIANTFKYVDKMTPITRDSIIGESIHSGKVVAVKDKAYYEHCKNCGDLQECAISGLVSVPIFFDQKVVGAIALLVPINKYSPVFENLEVSIDFLEGMSELLSSKLRSIDSYKNLNVIKKEREIILDMIEDGLVFISDTGEILHCNQKFESYFKLGENAIGETLERIIDHPLIHEIILFRKNYSMKSFRYEQKQNNSFYGFLSSRNITINGVNYGTLLTFRSIGKVYSLLNEVSDSKANISFNSIMGKDTKLMKEINKAKQLAVTDENILIYGEEGLRKSILARAIHNFSDRGKQQFILIDCNNTPYDLLESEIFGIEGSEHGLKPNIGKLRMAHKGTIFFKNIWAMPLYLQRRLVEFFKTKELSLGSYNDFHIDIRMIFDTNRDLSNLVEKKQFDEELYFRISKNTITIPSLANRKEDIQLIVDDMIEKLKVKHGRFHLVFQRDLLNKLYTYHWPKNLQEMERTIEHIIGNAEGSSVTLKDVEDFDFAKDNEIASKTMDDVEKELIEKMLSRYRCKAEVAKAMGIGRATLYRKLKKYNLNY